MKTLLQITTAIDLTVKEATQLIGAGAKKNKRAIDKLRKYCLFLKDCRLYLETNPLPETVQRMEREVTTKLTRIAEGFEVWKKCTPPSEKGKNPKSKYASEMGTKRPVKNY
jgi:hypothetical protein